MTAGERRHGRSSEELRKQQHQQERAWKLRNEDRQVLFVYCPADEHELYGQELLNEGFSVAFHCSHDGAFETGVELDPLVIVIDDSGSERGPELIRRFRADRRTEAALIVVLSSKGDDQSRTANRSAGADLFLTKPCLPDAMSGAIARLLAQSGAEALNFAEYTVRTRD